MKKIPRLNVTTYDDSYVDALHGAVIHGGGRRLAKIRTKIVRTLSTPERVTGKNGSRVFGAEIKRPATNGHRVRRIFTFQ